MNSCGLIKFNSIADSAGFFSNYFSVLSTMRDCLQRDLIPYVDASNTWFNPTCDFKNNIVTDSTINPWNWWFDQSIDGPSYDVPLNRAYINHKPSHFADQPGLAAFREIADKHCKIKKHILDEESKLHKEHLQDKKSLGILARGTEMLIHHPEYPKVQLETWPQIVEAYLNNFSDIDTIFVVSDDSQIINTIQAASTKVVYLKDFFRRTTQPDEAVANKHQPWWLTSPTGDPNHRRRLGEECLIQAKLLARCDYFLGTFSGVSNAALFFNDNKYKQSHLI